jgi:sugar phosphate isomerase/epimerase
MNHVLSTHLITNHRLTTVWLERVWEAGIPAVELFCAKPHIDCNDRAQISDLGHFFRASELTMHSMHGPLYTDDVWGRSGPHSIIVITEPDKSKRVKMLDEVKRAIEIAETIPFRYFIQHLGLPNDEYDERKLDAAFASLEELTLFAGQRGVEILLENIPNRMSTGERLAAFVAATHLHVGFCFDVGHANIGDGLETTFRHMKDRIRSTHLHDNDGVEDRHLFPFLVPGGTVDWSKTMSLLRSSGLPLLLELKENASIAQPIEAVKQVFQRLEEIE